MLISRKTYYTYNSRRRQSALNTMRDQSFYFFAQCKVIPISSRLAGVRYARGAITYHRCLVIVRHTFRTNETLHKFWRDNNNINMTLLFLCFMPSDPASLYRTSILPSRARAQKEVQ